MARCRPPTDAAEMRRRTLTPERTPSAPPSHPFDLTPSHVPTGLDSRTDSARFSAPSPNPPHESTSRHTHSDEPPPRRLARRSSSPSIRRSRSGIDPPRKKHARVRGTSKPAAAHDPERVSSYAPFLHRFERTASSPRANGVTITSEAGPSLWRRGLLGPGAPLFLLRSFSSAPQLPPAATPRPLHLTRLAFPPATDSGRDPPRQ